jgi:hypothetical protein
MAKWNVSGHQAYAGRTYWCIWTHHPGVYGSQRFVMSPSGTDRKRFYDEAKANAAAEKLNNSESKETP